MRYGSLCTGIGGLDLAVEATFDATPAWFCEADPHAARVLKCHWPGVPILPDLRTQDWTAVEPVDLVCAGYPCQPFSHAGRRQGVDDPRHLWPHVAAAVRVLRPRLVVLENVAGHLGLGFDAVLADLAALGFDAEWATVRASDAGACHRRERLFVVARHAERPRTDSCATPGGSRDAVGEPSRRLEECRQPDGRTYEPRLEAPRRADPDGCSTSPTDADEPRPQGPQPARRPDLPTGSGRPSTTDPAHQRLQRGGQHGDGGPDLRTVVADTYGAARRPERQGCRPGPLQGAEVDERPAVEPRRCDSGDRPAGAVDWGDYRPAIERWQHVIGRPAPDPTDDRGRLSVAFVCWMMGFPEGWVDGLTRTAALRCLGNSVVAQQGALALEALA